MSGPPDQPHQVNTFAQATPGQLRHSLRTPLNHVIGYAEMILEDLRDGVDGSAAAAIADLEAILFNARELVKFIRNGLPPEQTQLKPTELRDLQFWLRPHVVQMLEDIGSLAAESAPSHAADVDRIRAAAARLLGFTEGDADALDAPPAAVPESRSTSGTVKAMVLVVDDSAANRDILRRNLEREGYGAVTVADGHAALQAVREQPIDLVLLDVLMPGLSGFDVLQKLKSPEGAPGVPVIMISALDESSSVVRCMDMGAEDYFMKPFDPVLLRSRIRSTLERTSLAAALEKARQDMRQAHSLLTEALSRTPGCDTL